MPSVFHFASYPATLNQKFSGAPNLEAAGSGESRMRRRRLLILSREQTVEMQAVALAFRSRGWDVDISDLSTEALESIKKWLYDLVVMEIAHSGPEGFALCDVLRQHSLVPLLLIVSSVAKNYVIQGFRRGADAYVVEPFDMRELLVRAEALVRRAEGRAC